MRHQCIKKLLYVTGMLIFLTSFKFKIVSSLDISDNNFNYEEYITHYEENKPIYTEEDLETLFEEIYNIKNSTPIIGSTRVWIADPKYWLYTRKNPKDRTKIALYDTEKLKQSNFNFSTKTWLIIHGWMGNPYSPNPQILKNSYLRNWDDNVIMYDWSVTASNIYPVARYQIGDLGIKLAEFLRFLNVSGYPFEKVNIIGHSIGAHIAGIAGKQLGDDLIGSILGIDPSLPLFYTDNSTTRLCATDAKYVEVIHTNSGVLGYMEPIGDTDIYVNGGVFQPECGLLLGLCPHVKAFSIYIETIRDGINYTAYKCPNLDSVMRGNCGSLDNKLQLGGNLPKPWSAGVYSIYT